MAVHDRVRRPAPPRSSMMPKKTPWFLLSSVAFVGVGAVAGCGHSDTSVGTYQGPVQGDVCASAGTTQTTKDGCNVCQCGSARRWDCSNKACSGACNAGDSKRASDGCNTCTCQSDGTFACT